MIDTWTSIRTPTMVIIQAGICSSGRKKLRHKQQKFMEHLVSMDAPLHFICSYRNRSFQNEWTSPSSQWAKSDKLDGVGFVFASQIIDLTLKCIILVEVTDCSLSIAIPSLTAFYLGRKDFKWTVHFFWIKPNSDSSWIKCRSQIKNAYGRFLIESVEQGSTIWFKNYDNKIRCKIWKIVAIYSDHESIWWRAWWHR